MSSNSVSILEGNTFVVSKRNGDIDATPTDTSGLFHMDMRFLSKWILTINGQDLGILSTDDLQYFSAQFFLVPASSTVYVDSPLSILRKRAVSNGFHEDVIIRNESTKSIKLDIRMEAASDFADLFEVKDALNKKGKRYTNVEKNKLVLGYRRDKFMRETWITPTKDAEIDENGFSFSVEIEPHSQWKNSFDVIIGKDGYNLTTSLPKYSSSDATPKPNIGMSLEQWIAKSPKLVSTWDHLENIYKRSLIDLAALRFYSFMFPHESLPAAGLPWFMAVFGRDSIITSLQALPFQPELAHTTLRLLAARMGSTVDDFRDEEPGKILHEVRLGEVTAFEDRPQSPYYGTADATPLFVILLDEYERWTGDRDLVKMLELETRLALEWIDKYGDRDGDGYIEYERRADTGLENQCWKDSWDSIRYHDGSIASTPRATCELQGYAYDAKIRGARLAREFWNDENFATQLEVSAAKLKKQFNKDFWVKDGEFFALALDGQKKQVDSLTSNIGHLLWSGIIEVDNISATVNKLMGPELFSGWGVRTMATSEGGYNPIGYHIGTVWPHDNSMIALGLRKAGYPKEAAQIAMGILEAATFFNNRLPEAFAGYDRSLTHFPVEYPTACSPQAWATGAPLLFIRTLLGLEPIGKKLLVDPAIPNQIERIELFDIQGTWGKIDAIGLGKINI